MIQTYYKILIIGLILVSNQSAFAQNKCDSLQRYQFPDYRNIDTSVKSRYSFVDFSKNNYTFYSDKSPNFSTFYTKLSDLEKTKKGKLNFYHIGGSHLQADIYTNDVREFLQLKWPEAPGERGWVFPFDLAKTNNPGNYEFSSPNIWKAYRSVVHKSNKYDIDYGVLGAMISCSDTAITINFNYDRTTSKPPFNHIRIFHNIGEFPYWMHFGEDELLVVKTINNPNLGYSDVYFCEDLTSFDLQFQPLSQSVPELEIYGFTLMNDLPGISYSSIGINGAGLYTYLDCKRFEEQLTCYPPDFFAYSVGTNDGNVPYADFRPEVYKSNLEKMMKIALRANPDCALLLTVPNDSYYHRKYLNKNIAREREVIIELAAQYKMAVWDLYGVMGELGSSRTWKNNALMRSDLVHFTTEGYHFKGDLYIDGLLKFMDQMDACTKSIAQ